MGNPTYTYISLTPTNDTYDISRSYTISIPNHMEATNAVGRAWRLRQTIYQPSLCHRANYNFFNNILHPDIMPTSTR